MALAAAGVGAGTAFGSGGGILDQAPGGKTSTDPSSQLGSLPVDPQWLANTLQRASTTTSVKNNLAPDAITLRNKADAQWEAAEAKWRAHKGPEPNPLAKQEYLVVWSGKQNGADVYGKELGELVTNATINPEGLSQFLSPQFLPGLDGFQVVDGRKLNIDGTPNLDYGHVVNFVQLPLPWGVETEAHHMQYEWHDGQPIIAGGLFNDTAFVLSVKDIPNMTLQNIIPPQAHLGGSIPDAFDEVGNTGTYIGTWMGGPAANYGGSPGEVLSFTPDKTKGLVQASETSAGSIGGVESGNAGGVPEPCTIREGEPLETCANPHGIQIRQDVDRMVTADYAEPREIVLDPVKTVDQYAFRPTVRVWDTTNPVHPKLVSVAHMPQGPQNPVNQGHGQIGIMEDAKTWPDATRYKGGLQSKGFFSESMCGGGIFFAPDVTKLKGDSSSQWKEVFNDAIPEVNATGGQFQDEPGGCDGGSWVQVAPNNRLLFHTIIGRAPTSDNYYDQGELKLVYDVDISKLIKDAQSGKVICDLSNGIHTDGYDLTGMQALQQLEQGKQIADCPKLISTLVVNDPTTGGPHWAALDDSSIDQNGVPYRLAFSDYFVSRSGVDGDHIMYDVNVSPTGKLSYDNSFRDENTSSLGVDFNRRDWPGSPDAGFYKPHSMLWVCPPGICPLTPQITPRGANASKAKAKRKQSKRLVHGKRARSKRRA
ncbi:MAG TPA: hypothetical protein VGF81_16645 [Solirubrobacteraceae bacterium]